MYEGKTLMPEQVVEYALSLTMGYKEVHESHNQNTQSRCNWIPPPSGTFKLNVDGAIFAYQCSAGVGIILRNDKGEIILSTSKKESEVNDPLKVEMLAIFRALQICIPLDLNELLIESDSLIMVNEILTEGESVFIGQPGL